MNIKIRGIDSIENLRVYEKCIISIDGSTDITGLAVVSLTGRPLYTLAFIHEREKESAVHYKVKLKRELLKILLNNRNFIEGVYYEQPFIGYANATKNLFMLRTSVEELKFENEEQLGDLKCIEINNLKWKKQFLYPSKCPTGTDLQKKAVRDRLRDKQIIDIDNLTQDEIDATSMGLVAVRNIDTPEDLESKKQTRPFKYNIEFIGAEGDDILYDDLCSICSAPKKVLENGIDLHKLRPRMNLDKQIYEFMGSEDKLLILKFNSNSHGNIILDYNLGEIADDFPYIYSFVWRKTRKRGVKAV